MTANSLPAIEARVVPLPDKSPERPTRLLGVGEIVIAGAFKITSIRILQKRDGSDDPFVVFPAERGRGDKSDLFYDIAHPITAAAREAAVSAIMAAYIRAINQIGA